MLNSKALGTVLLIPAALGCTLAWLDPEAPGGWTPLVMLLTGLAAALVAVGVPLAAASADPTNSTKVVISVSAVGMLAPFLAGFANTPRVLAISVALLLVGLAEWFASLVVARRVSMPNGTVIVGGLAAGALGALSSLSIPGYIVPAGAAYLGYGSAAFWAWVQWREHIDKIGREPSVDSV